MLLTSTVNPRLSVDSLDVNATVLCLARVLRAALVACHLQLGQRQSSGTASSLPVISCRCMSRLHAPKPHAGGCTGLESRSNASGDARRGPDGSVEDLMDPWKRQGRAAPRPQTTRNPGAVPYDGTVVFLQGTAPWLTAGDTRRLAQLTRGMAGSPLSKQHRIASQRSSKTHHSVCSALLCDIPIGIPSQDDD